MHCASYLGSSIHALKAAGYLEPDDTHQAYGVQAEDKPGVARHTAGGDN
jgi:hypothetical protein